MQEHAGQHLADLVVQVAGDPDALGLLCGEHPPTALLALALEPVEHPVEGDDDAADLVVADDRQALAGTQQVDRLHPLRQPLEAARPPVAAEDAFAVNGDHQPSDDDQRLRRP